MLAKIWNFRGWTAQTDERTLTDLCGPALRAAGFHVLGEIEHRFQPQGYTKLYLLGESHFAIHTFPECGQSYIELSSCNEAMFERCVAIIGKALAINPE